ncbi:hypothetical protein KKC59_03090, partial [bacterium]|nr:hypothetical protein [bacterium]
LFLFVIFLAARVGYSEEDSIAKEIMKKIEYTADTIEFQKEHNLVIGTGNVSVSYGEMKLRADKVIIDLSQKKAFASGNVNYTNGQDSFTGEEIVYDFINNQGSVKEASIEAYPWHVHSDSINRKMIDEITVEEGVMTTCDLDRPCWKLRAKHLDIYLDDKIIAKNVIVYLYNVPIFYWPTYSVSLTDTRGKIVFVPGRNSKWGSYAFTGYRYNINENNRGTARLDVRERKGIAYGVDHEYEYKNSQGLFRVYYMNERDKETHPITETERYRVKWTHKQVYTDNLWSVFEWHEMSDKDFIKDYIQKEYYNDPTPESYIYLQNKFPQSNLNLYASKQTNTFFDQVEYQPEIKYHTNRINIEDTPFYFNLDYSAANINNESLDEGDSLNRVDLYQEFAFSEKIAWLTINPYVGARETYYSKDKSKSKEVRGVLYSGITLNTKIHNTIDTYSDFWDINQLRIVHEPSVTYNYIHEPTVTPDKLYQFDSIDSIENENYIRFKLKNRLQTKRFKKDKPVNKNLIEYEVYVDYYPKGLDYGYCKRDISNIYENYTFAPFDNLSLEIETRIDPYYKRYESVKLDLNYNAGEKGFVTLSHDYRREEDSFTSLGYRFDINKKWKAKISHSYDFNKKRMTRQEYTLYRDMHCWMTALTFAREKDDVGTDNEIWLAFYLKDFPGEAFDYTEGMKTDIN